MEKMNEETLKLFDYLYNVPEVINRSKEEQLTRGEKWDLSKKDKNITDFFNSLEREQQKTISTPEGLEMLKNIYHDRYVIKREDMPQGLFYEIKDLDSELSTEEQEEIIEETENENDEIANTIIEDQRRSLDEWLDYFFSEESNCYPFWAKYWALQGMLKIGGYDEQKDSYYRRSKRTIGPFIELNREALAIAIDYIIKFIGKEEITDEEVVRMADGNSFQKLYPYLLNRVLKDEQVKRKRNEGIWVKYNQGSDPSALVKSISGRNTGWNIAGEATAKRQLQKTNVYVYYTLDDKNEYKVPKIAIAIDDNMNFPHVMGRGREFEIEEDIIPIIEEKIREFPRNEEVGRALYNMKLLMEMKRKQEAQKEFTQEELRCLYEIDYPLLTLGLGYRNLADQLREERKTTLIEDLEKATNLDRTQIALTESEITENTIYCRGDIVNFDKIPIKNGKKVFPKHVGGSVQVFDKDHLKGIIFPDIVVQELLILGLWDGDDIYLPKKSQVIHLGREHLNIYTFPETMEGGLSSETYHLKDFTFPKRIKGTIFLMNLESATDVVLPEEVDELRAPKLNYIYRMTLPNKMKTDLYLPKVKDPSGLIFPDELTYTIHLDGIDIDSTNVDQYRKKATK